MRYARVSLRLAELNDKYGQGTPETLETTDHPDPSWGPLGSLARASIDSVSYQRLLEQHDDLLALERSRRPTREDPPMKTPPIAAPPRTATDPAPVWQRDDL